MFANWNPNPFVDLVSGANGFLPAGAGIGDPESTSMPRNANGWPQASWQLLCYQAGNRPNPSTIKTGVWKIRVTDTAAGNSGVLTASLAGATISNQVRTGQVVTADMTVTSSSEPFIAFAYPHAITEFRVIDPDFPIDTTRILNDEARAFCARQYGFRILNLSGQNSQQPPRSNNWATEEPMQKAHGLKGWGFLCDMYVEIATAPGSRCKRFGLNAPPKWRHGPGDVADFTSWVTYVRSKTIGVSGSITTWSSTNETWNGGTYLHFHWFMQQARNGIVNPAVGDLAPWWLPATADITRIQSGTSDQFVQWARWWGLRDARLANVVKSVYGADFGTRTLFNCETHLFNPYWHRDIILPWLSLSPQTTEFGQPNSYIHTLSVAPYISIQGDLIPGITSAANALAVMRNGAGNSESMDGCLAQVDVWTGVASTFSLGGVVLYEFNSTHLDPYFDTAQGQFLIDAINSAGSKTLMRDFLDALNTRGLKYAYALGCWPMTYPPLGGGLSKQNTMWGMTQNYSYTTPSSPSSRIGGYRAAAVDEYLAAHE